MSDDGCQYSIAYGGACGDPTYKQTRYCKEHWNQECFRNECDRIPTHECTFAGSFVCGFPVCPEHGCRRGHERCP